AQEFLEQAIRERNPLRNPRSRRHVHVLRLRRRKNPCKPWGVVPWAYHRPRSPSPPGACTMTTAKATATRTILALDLGKYKSVACAYQGGPAEARFDSLTTDRQHLRALFARHRPAVVVIEA